MKLKPLALIIGLTGLLAGGLMSGATLAQSKKAGQPRQQSCDGVLDVVPAKALTFTRKRRPGKEANATDIAPAAPETSPKTTRKKSR